MFDSKKRKILGGLLTALTILGSNATYLNTVFCVKTNTQYLPSIRNKQKSKFVNKVLTLLINKINVKYRKEVKNTLSLKEYSIDEITGILKDSQEKFSDKFFDLLCDFLDFLNDKTSQKIEKWNENGLLNCLLDNSSNEKYNLLASELMTLFTGSESNNVPKININNESKSNMPQVNQYNPKGIKNLGLSCYLNSAFQHLFALENFRNQVLSSNPSREQSPSLYYTKLVFNHLSGIGQIMEEELRNCMNHFGYTGIPNDSYTAFHIIKIMCDAELGKRPSGKVTNSENEKSFIPNFISGDPSKSNDVTAAIQLGVDVEKSIENKFDNLVKNSGTFGNLNNPEVYLDSGKFTVFIDRAIWGEQSKVGETFASRVNDYIDLGTIDTLIFINNGKKVGKDNKIFELTGFTYYSGAHYIAYIKEGNQWVKYNDSKINQISTNDALRLANTHASMLVYSLIS